MARSNTGSTSNYLSSTVVTGITAAPVTLACWFNPAAITADYNLLCLAKDGVGSHEYFVLGAAGTTAGDPVNAAIAGSAAFLDCFTSTGFSADTWHHACGVYTSSTSRTAYLDGAGAVTDTTACTPSGINQVQAGIYTKVGGFFGPVNGRIAEAGIWNVALTAAEVLSLARGVSPRMVRPASLIRYFPLIGNFSPEIDLRGGAGLTMTGTMAKAAHVPIRYPHRRWVSAVPAAGGGGGGFQVAWARNRNVVLGAGGVH